MYGSHSNKHIYTALKSYDSNYVSKSDSVLPPMSGCLPQCVCMRQRHMGEDRDRLAGI